MELLQIETALAAVLGGGVTTAVARYFIVRALNELSEITKQLQAIREKLSVIEVKLGQLEKLQETAIAHDRKITEIQSRLKYERPSSFGVTGQARMQET